MTLIALPVHPSSYSSANEYVISHISSGVHALVTKVVVLQILLSSSEHTARTYTWYIVIFVSPVTEYDGNVVVTGTAVVSSSSLSTISETITSQLSADPDSVQFIVADSVVMSVAVRLVIILQVFFTILMLSIAAGGFEPSELSFFQKKTR